MYRLAKGYQVRRSKAQTVVVNSNNHQLADEPLVRARPCSVCGGRIVLGVMTLVHRDGSNRVIGCACTHLYCRAKLRESFSLISDADAGYVN